MKKQKEIKWYFFSRYQPSYSYDFLVEDHEGNRNVWRGNGDCHLSSNIPMAKPIKFAALRRIITDADPKNMIWVLENGEEIKLEALYDHEPLFPNLESI